MCSSFAPIRALAARLLPVVFCFLFFAGLAGPLASQDVVINELSTSNGGVVRDEEGDSPDWVELLNRGAVPVDLLGYGLSDGTDPFQWTFPAVTLAPGAHQVVFCSGKARSGGPLHWETVIDVGDTWRYRVPTSEPPAAWRTPGFSDAGWSAGPTGIGYGDGDDQTEVPAGTVSVYARKTFQLEDLAQVLEVWLDLDYDDGFVAYLNGVEVARDNLGVAGVPPAFTDVAPNFTEPRLVSGGSLLHVEGEALRGALRTGENVLAIQLHNTGTTSSDLTLLPLLTLGLASAPANARGPGALIRSRLPGLHTSFKLAGGETVRLTTPDGATADSVVPGDLPPDVSLGRYPDGTGEFSFHSPPTPGQANGSPGYASIGSPVAFSRVGLFQGAPFQLGLTKSEPDGVIHYTTDGSVPTESSPVYVGPLSISKTSVVRARTLGPGLYPGHVETQTFILGRTSTLPVVSLSTDPANFFDTQLGIYVNGDSFDPSFPYFGSNFWEDWERPIHIELYEADGTPGFSAEAGTKIFGGWSRGNPQRSLAFFARGQYGTSRFRYRLFPDKPLDEFESFILRNSGNDWQITHFRDALMTSLVTDLGIDHLAYRPSAVFLNGEYWGILNLREKINEHFLAANHRGVKSDQIDLLEADASVIHGDADHYRAMLALLEGTDPVSPETLAQVEAMVDLENFIAYQASQIYFDNTDWPGNNIKFWRPRTPEGRWRWILYDTDFGFGIWNAGNYSNNTLAFALEPNGPGWPNPPWSTFLLRRLLTNPDVKQRFVNRFATHLSTVFAPARVIARIDQYARAIEQEMPAQRARWGGTLAEWRANVQVLRDFANRRVAPLRGYLGSTLGLGAQAQLRLTRSAGGGGSIAVEGRPVDVYPFTGTYFQGLPIRLEARPEPGYRFLGWTGVEPAAETAVVVNLGPGTLTVGALFELDCAASSRIVLNEIEYNAPQGADPGDWVELFNRSATAVDLSGWKLQDSSALPAYSFPPGTSLESGGYLVVCASRASFLALHPTLGGALGDLGFSLDGGGETLELLDAGGEVVDSVTFDDRAPWPVEADGTGATLALKNHLLENNHGGHWAASLAGGTPGARNDVFVDLGSPCGAETIPFLRGDLDGDGSVTIADPVRFLFASFAGASLPCRAAADVNGDGGIGGVTDAIHLLNYLFQSGAPPAAPFPRCGAPTLPGDLVFGCETAPARCP